MPRYLLLLVLLSILIIKASAQSPVKRILLEEFSTAPCGFCPDGDVIAERLIKDHPSVIWMTHHAGFGTDSMTVAESKLIAGAFTTFAPGACIDRGDHPIPVYTIPPYIAVSRQKWDSVCVAHLGDAPVVDVKIVNAFNAVSRTLDCTVEATFVSTPPAGDIRVNIFLVEDSVVGYGKGFDQLNYMNGTPGHPYYKKGDTIVGYVHKRVLRSVPTTTWGISGIIPSSPELNKTYSYSRKDIPISTRWKENALDVIAFLSYYNTDAKQRAVINANQRRMLGEVSAVREFEAPGSVVLISPNPVRDDVTIRYQSKQHGRHTLIITDALGKTVRSFSLDEASGVLSFSMNDAPNGIYFWKLVGEKEVQVGKLIVTR